MAHEEEGFNALAISVLQARNLVCTKAEQPTSQVKIKCGLTVFETKPVKDTSAPRYMKKFYLPLKPIPKAHITVSVAHYQMVKNFPIGSITFKTSDIVNKAKLAKGPLKSWYDLQNDNLFEMTSKSKTKRGGDTAGQIMIQFELENDDNPRAKPKDGEDTTGQYNDQSDMVNFTDKMMLTSSESMRMAMKQEEEKCEAIEPGDYTINVHILEVRDIASENKQSREPSPMIKVEGWGQTKHTKIQPYQSNCIFDEHLAFKLLNASRDSLLNGVISIECVDSSTRSHMVVGTYQIDFKTLYFKEGHELWRQWVALGNMDAAVHDSDEDSDHIRGYILLSIAIIGPGDMPVVHNESQEQLAQKSFFSKDNALFPPQIKQELRFLVVQLHKAEGIPAMDHTITGKRGVDAQIDIEFGNVKAAKTSVRTVQGNQNSFDVDFNLQITIPFPYPTNFDRIALSMWDNDIGRPNEIIATSPNYSLKMVRKFPAAFRLFWINLYGAPLPAGVPSETSDKMNKGDLEQSTFRGRLLVSMWEDTIQSTKKHSPGRARMHSATNTHHLDIPPVVPVQEETYVLRAHVYFGSQLPMKVLSGNKVKITVSIGSLNAKTETVVNKGGLVSWQEGDLEIALALPSALNQVPDIFVYLTRDTTLGNEENICYLRFNAEDIHASTVAEFDMKPKWHVFKPDPVVNAVDKSMYPGAILMGLSFAPFDIAAASNIEFEPVVADAPYRLNVYLYSGRNLLPSDRSGALDPYVNVLFGGETKKSETKIQTRCPSYMEAITFDMDLPRKEAFMPDITLEVMDYDRWDPDDFTGRVHVPITRENVYVRTASDRSPEKAQPKWYPLYFQKKGDTLGELLLAFELIYKDDTTNAAQLKKQCEPRFEEIKMCPYRVDILAFGLKGLKANARKPMVEIRVGDETDPNKIFKTDPSNYPSVNDCHFGEVFCCNIDLPWDVRFAPSLNITVFEGSAGLSVANLAVLGHTSVSLDEKIPFSNGQKNPLYKEPGHEKFYFTSDFEQERMKKAFGSFAKIGVKESAEALHDGLGELEYMKDRERVGRNLEEVLPGQFEMYPIYAGNANTLGSESIIDSFRVTGIFKGIIMISDINDKSAKLAVSQEALDKNNKRSFCIRAYCLTSHLLAPPPSGRPYMKVKMGKRSLRAKASSDGSSEVVHPDVDSSDDEMGMTLEKKKRIQIEKKRKKQEVSRKTLMADFLHKEKTSSGKYHLFHCFEFDDMIIPGVPRLEIKLKDKDMMGRSITLGQTVIDIEDRWFSDDWKKLGNSKISEGIILKPLETRPLWKPTSLSSQGTLDMWVDILPTEQTDNFPLIDIEPPAPSEFEVRLIIYKAKLDADKLGCLSVGDYNTMQAIYFKAWIGQTTPQKTDIHRNTVDGKCGFNWRMKFIKTLPAQGYGEARLFIQGWERDKAKGDECLCETMLDLSEAFGKAVTNNEAVDCFTSQSKAVDAPDNEEMEGRGYDSDADVEEGLGLLDPMGPLTSAAGLNSFMPSKKDGGYEESKGGRSETAPLLSQGSTEIHPVTGNRKPSVAMESQKRPVHKRKKTKKVTAMARTTFRTLVDIDSMPEDATWLKLFKNNEETGRPEDCGKILISCEIIPKEVADTIPTGYGRSEPNQHPFLIEPFGRPPSLKNALNPIYTIRNLINDPSYRIYMVYAAVGCVVLNIVLILTYFGLSCLAVYVVLKSMGYR